MILNGNGGGGSGPYYDTGVDDLEIRAKLLDGTVEYKVRTLRDRAHAFLMDGNWQIKTI